MGLLNENDKNSENTADKLNPAPTQNAIDHLHSTSDGTSTAKRKHNDMDSSDLQTYDDSVGLLLFDALNIFSLSITFLGTIERQ